MTLSSTQLRDLSRLLDQALALPAEERGRWLDALPPAAQPLLGPLRRALSAAEADGHSLDGPPPDGAVEESIEPGPGERIGPWRLIDELGRGGMGRVWRAERADGLYRREVALKLPRLARGPTLAARMQQEQQIAARLEHPLIARLYDASIDDCGRPYLVMERIDGRPIDAHCDALQLDVPQRLRLLLQVCEAVAHAHRRLVVHRDLKPSNLLVTPEGSMRLLDFGVARLLEEGEGSAGSPGSATLPEGVGGHTPRYAAPEQRRGEPVTTSADLYALARIAFELLTGRLPDHDDRVPASQAGFGDAEAQRRGCRNAAALRRRLRGGIDAVLSRALAADPAQRHGSVDQFAAELADLLGHRVPESWRASPLARFGCFARRHAAALVVASGALALVAAGGVAVAQEQARTRAEEARLDRARRFMLELLWTAEPAAGQARAAVTTAQLLDMAVHKAGQELASDPLLQADVLHEAAVLARHLGQAERTQALLTKALSLARQGSARDATAHIVAAQLAMQRAAQGGEPALDEADALARSSLAGCTATTRRCAVARAYATDALAAVAAARGDAQRAIDGMRRSVAEHEQAFGADHPNTGWQRLNLATRLRNVERYAEALVEVDRAAAGAALVAWDGASTIRLRTTQALLRADLGQHGEARDGLRQLLSTLEPGRPERALALRLQAQSAFALGLLDEALEAAPPPHARPATAGEQREQALLQQTRLRALGALGRHDEAADAWAQTRDLLAGLKLPPDSPLQARMPRLAAELALRRGQTEVARSLLEPMAAGERSGPGSPAIEAGLALDLLAAVERFEGRPEAALVLHERAAARLAGLPVRHPLRMRNHLEASWARALARTDAPYPDEGLRDAATAYLSLLPADSAWRPVVHRLLADRAAVHLLLP